MNDKKFNEEPFTPPSEMSKEELELHITNWRNQYSWLTEEVKYWLSRVGTDIKVLRRDYHPIVGTLGQPKFELKQIEIDTMEEEKDYFRKVLTSEVKTVVIGLNQLIDYEWLHSVKHYPIDERGELVSDEAIEELEQTK